MNENIGVKGENNDLRKQKKIFEKKKKKEELEIEELEKSVKKLQFQTAIIAIPLIISANAFRKLLLGEEKEEKSTIFLPKTSLEKKDKVFITENDSHELVEVTLTTNRYKNKKILAEASPDEKLILKAPKEEPETLEKVDSNSKEKTIIEQDNHKIEIRLQKQEYIPIKEEISSVQKEDIQLDRLTNTSIINQYEKELKGIRIELKKVIYEYNVLVDYSDNLYHTEEVEKLLLKLNKVIKKIEELKQKLQLENFDKYEKDYLENLAYGYIFQFKNKKMVEDIKDSELYIMISEKLEELDLKKDILTEKLQNKKEILHLDEEKLRELKEKYDSYEDFNSELLKVQYEQDSILNDINIKIANSIEQSQRVETKVRALNDESLRLMHLIIPQMLIPGPRSARRIAFAAMLYIRFMRNIMRPQIQTRHYQVLTVTDYSKEISDSISQIDKGMKLIIKSKQELDKTIKEFEKNYYEYFQILPEYEQLLYNLQKVCDSLLEKEEELKRLKEEEEKNLEKNNEKVKMVNEYNKNNQSV